MKRVLISVSDKTNIVEFARKLVGFDYEIISTGGTKLYLEKHNIKVTSVDDITSFPEILDGRVKTLHPNIYGGILCDRSNRNHLLQIEKFGIKSIDMVVVNLYPFLEITKSNCELDEAISNIDIGGPSLLRAAAKNFKNVVVLCDYNDYFSVLDEINCEGEVCYDSRLKYSAKAFNHCAIYNNYIASYLGKERKDTLNINYDLAYELRYGENPHQNAKFYKDFTTDYSLAKATILHGKQLSYNNILDASAALNIIKEFDECVVAIIKHTNPCGVAIASNVLDAYVKAYNADSLSAFGGIVAFNRQVTKDVAKQISKVFLEVIIAPNYDAEALKILKKKKNIRILQVNMDNKQQSKQLTSVNGGILVQDYDMSEFEKITVVCGEVDAMVIEDLKFAFRVCKHVKSNAICVVKDGVTLGIGAGQMSRIGACEIALKNASLKKQENLVLASDAFFPFDDVIILAKRYGVSAIIQPGGSINDKQIIDKCVENGIALIFSYIRSFKH